MKRHLPIKSHTIARVALSAGLACLALGAAAVPARASPKPPVSPAILSSAPTRQRVVALTFDDGPSPYTPRVLTLLRADGVHATFFVVGMHVTQYPSLVRAEVELGDEVGNHTYTHADLRVLDAPDVHLQLSATQSAVYAAAHVTPMWFRPPFGDVDGRVASLAARLGLQTVLWSVDPRDWTRPGTAVIVERVLAAVRPGSVVIMHDGGGDRSETVAALPSILRALRDRGYQCVTLSDLFFPGQRATPAPPAPSHSGGQGHPHKRRAPGSPGLGGS